MYIPPDVIAAGPAAQRHYQQMIQDGQAPLFAEMCATRTPPGTKGTDRAFMENRCNNQQLDNLPPEQARRLVAAARKAGINISGKYYSAQLADKRGAADPAAWVDSTADVVKVARTRNYTVSGAASHRGEAVPPKRKALSERLTKEMMAKEKKRNPKLKDGELREKVVAKYSYKGGGKR